MTQIGAIYRGERDVIRLYMGVNRGIGLWMILCVKENEKNIHLNVCPVFVVLRAFKRFFQLLTKMINKLYIDSFTPQGIPYVE